MCQDHNAISVREQTIDNSMQNRVKVTKAYCRNLFNKFQSQLWARQKETTATKKAKHK